LGELPAVEGVGDEVAPAFGDALGSVEILDGDAREDLHEGVVGEASHRAVLLRALHAAANGEGNRDAEDREEIPASTAGMGNWGGAYLPPETVGIAGLSVRR